MLKLLSGYLVKKKALWSLKVSKSDGCRKKEIRWENPNKINIVVLVTLEKKKKNGMDTLVLNCSLPTIFLLPWNRLPFQVTFCLTNN